MFRIKLLPEIRKELLKRHKTVRDKREADRIKAVLLSDDGWTNAMIANALFICQETVHDHLTDYVEEQKLKPENGGSSSKLSDAQASELVRHLEENTYMKVKAICSYVETKYCIIYTVAGMTKWLHEHRFSYKKPKPTPAKADAAKQAEFIAEYERLKTERPSNEPIVFIDAVHPTMATKTTEGWIRTGKDKLIPTTASRTRINIVGALNLETMDLVTQSYKTVNSVSMCSFFEWLRGHYPDAPKIHVISDQGPYNISHVTKAAAAKNNIVLHYLPTYSPNLNPIERVWKVVNEMVRNNAFFASAKAFRGAIFGFFDAWSKISEKMRSRINDKFQRINWASSG